MVIMRPTMRRMTPLPAAILFSLTSFGKEGSLTCGEGSGGGGEMEEDPSYRVLLQVRSIGGKLRPWSLVLLL
jgi:hypothetical protein